MLAVPLHAAESIDLSSPELIAAGSEAFAMNCSVGYCHGSAGRPARGPALRDRVWDPRDLYRITAEGLAGTSMPGWQGLMTEDDIWAVVAYVMSLSTEPPSGGAAIVEAGGSDASVPQSAALSAKAEQGKALFFDLTRERRCGVCHELDGMGTAVGPNLALSPRAKTSTEIARAIREPDAEIAFGFEQVRLDLRSGERIAGVLAEETETRIRIFDAASVPPPLRSVARSSIRSQTTHQRSSMPDGWDEVYSGREIALIVAFVQESVR